MPADIHQASSQPAIVSRLVSPTKATSLYLQLTAESTPLWISDAEGATCFASMREATRAAARLPASTRAFGVLRQAELRAAHDIH
jgi:hypothetical protein